MEREELERAIANIQKSVAFHMQHTLESIREACSAGHLSEDFNGYIALFRDGRETVLNPDEMMKLSVSDDAKNLLLTIYIWIEKESSSFFSCCEIASSEGIIAHWVAKVNNDPDEEPGWVDPDEIGGSWQSYFQQRKSDVSQALNSARAQAVADDNDLSFDPARWVNNSKASDHGVN